MGTAATIRLIYMTPDFSRRPELNSTDEFENLGDLIRRAKLSDMGALVNKSMVYYCYYLDALESGRRMITRPYDNPRPEILDDALTDDYRQTDAKDLNIETGVLDKIRERAGLETIDELLLRGMILFEKVVCAREWGWGIGLYCEKTGDTEWIFDDPPQGKNHTKKFGTYTIQ